MLVPFESLESSFPDLSAMSPSRRLLITWSPKLAYDDYNTSPVSSEFRQDQVLLAVERVQARKSPSHLRVSSGKMN